MLKNFEGENFIPEYIWTEHSAIVVLFIFSLFCGLWVAICKNPIFSLIFLIMTFSGVIGIFLILNIEFLALTFLIIYIGAIAILFLFVIMMFNMKQLNVNKQYDDEQAYPFELFYFVTTIFIITVIFEQVLWVSLDRFTFCYVYNSNKLPVVCNYEELLYIIKYKSNDILLLSDFLYTSYGYIFMLTGVILLSSMFGSIILAMLSQDKNILQNLVFFQGLLF